MGVRNSDVTPYTIAEAREVLAQAGRTFDGEMVALIPVAKLERLDATLARAEGTAIAYDALLEAKQIATTALCHHVSENQAMRRALTVAREDLVTCIEDVNHTNAVDDIDAACKASPETTQVVEDIQAITGLLHIMKGGTLWINFTQHEEAIERLRALVGEAE